MKLTKLEKERIDLNDRIMAKRYRLNDEIKNNLLSLGTEKQSDYMKEQEERFKKAHKQIQNNHLKKL